MFADPFLGASLGLVVGVGVPLYHCQNLGQQLAVAGPVENLLRFAGREYDAESGL